MDIVNKISQLINHSGAMKYLSNISWLLIEKILRLIAGLLVGIWVARYLGPEQFGKLSYAQSFVAIISVLAVLGLNDVVIRDLVKDEHQRDILLGTAFVLKLIGSMLVLALITILMQFQSNDFETIIIIIVIASSLILNSFNVIDFYFQSKVLSKYIVYSNIFSLIISSIIKIVLILNQAPLLAFAFVILFDSFILACGFIFVYSKNKLSIFNWTINKALAKSLLKNCWPLILSGFVISLYMKIDQIMIKEMLGVSSVGQYAAAVQLSEAWYFIPMVISASLFPAILNAKQISKELYYSRLQRLYDLMAWMAILIALPMTFLSTWLIGLLYGVQFEQAGGVLTIHIWSAVFVFLGVSSSKWYMAENLQVYLFYRTLAGAVINILLNLVLIPRYGLYGGAIATLVAQITASFVFNAIHQETRITFTLQCRALLLPVRKFF